MQHVGPSFASRGLTSCLETSDVGEHDSTRLASFHSMVNPGKPGTVLQGNTIVVGLCNPGAVYPVVPLSLARCRLKISLGLFTSPN